LNYLAGFSNLQTVRRNGLRRYNNQDYSVLTAVLTAGNINGKQRDVWQVNIDMNNYEDVRQ
jgi:hypothetical protein